MNDLKVGQCAKSTNLTNLPWKHVKNNNSANILITILQIAQYGILEMLWCTYWINIYYIFINSREACTGNLCYLLEKKVNNISESHNQYSIDLICKFHIIICILMN